MNRLENLRETLLGMADPAYRDFNARIIPGAGEMLGIRIPQLRQMARRIAHNDNWRQFVDRDDCRFLAIPTWSPETASRCDVPLRA